MRKIIFTLFGAALLSACSDSYLDIKPEDQIKSENFFKTKEDALASVSAIYTNLRTWDLAAFAPIILSVSSDDADKGSSPGDAPFFNDIKNFTFTASAGIIEGYWSGQFRGVNLANQTISNIPTIAMDDALKSRLLAEARFFRAYHYFNLVKLYGGVPIYDGIPADGNYNLPRNSKEEVYNFILADLKFAEENLPANYGATDIGRATKGAALALLGKAYLYQNKFSEAAAALEQVITSQKYSLVTDYASIFEMAGENGTESVFEVQYTDVEGAGFPCLQCSEGNVAVGFSGIRSYKLSPVIPGVPNPNPPPKYTSGFSFNVPTEETYNSFEVGDTRLNASVLDIVAWNTANKTEYGKGNEDTGYFNQKYLPRVRSGQAQGDLNLTNPNNYRAIRYADVLLMAAEALNRGGINDAKALVYLNQVRDRAFGDTNHRISSVGSALTDVIWKERRAEFVGEGFRFFDLVRTGKAAGTIPGFKAGKNELFPIPLQEIQFSAGNWNQNPGY